MTWNEVFRNTFKELRERISPETRKQVDLMLPSWPMVDACRADSLDAFQPFIAAGKLSVEDMHQACDRYHLGKTKTGTPIYWMIDDMNTPLDAHIGDRWISTLLKQREPLIANWQVQHCLFGLHLLAHAMSPAAIVESESSAIVLSALFPETIWLAYATTSHLSPDLFAPLEGRIVTIYPRTDPTLSNYLFFQDLVTLTQEYYDIDISVDSTLEDNATPTQKDRCIDLLDFLKESLNAPAEKSS